MKEEIITKLEFLKLEEFLLIEEQVSKYFGDFYYRFSNGKIDIIVVSDRSLITFDVCSTAKPKEKYDLLIVRSLILGINEYELSIEDQMIFLKDYLNHIINMFMEPNYKFNSQKLKEIEIKRGKALFPGW